MTEFRYHPEIEGLKVNEDGSQIFLHDKQLDIKVHNKGEGKATASYIYYNTKMIGLAKIVLECWKGQSPEINLTAKHIDNDTTNFHHTNLRWGKKGGNPKFPSKLTPTDQKEILQKLESGIQGSTIAKEYGVTRNAIYQLRNKQEK